MSKEQIFRVLELGVASDDMPARRKDMMVIWYAWRRLSHLHGKDGYFGN